VSHSHFDNPTNTHDHHDNNGLIAVIGAALHLPGFGHNHQHGYQQLAADPVLHDNELGVRTIWFALTALGITAVLQIVIYLASGSVALFADTVHNLGDALNSVPLLIAFYLARLPANRRFTYGYGRAEDIAGVLIVLSIAFSASYILIESVQKLFDPQPLDNLGWVALAALIGFVGNELVAVTQIRVGRQIDSVAMIADGQHARIDGLTSLAVLIAVFGAWMGLPILDPIIGVVIALAIVGISWNAMKSVWLRLLDGVDPSIINRLEHFTSEVTGVERVAAVRAHYVGHRLFAEMTIVVDENLSLVESHQIAENVRKRLHQVAPNIGDIAIHVDPNYEYQDFDSKSAVDFLPPRYQNASPSPAPMGAAGLKFNDDGSVAWNEIWTDFCDLALAGGPPHRGTLLEPVNPADIEANPAGYESTLNELERGVRMVTGAEVVRSETPGWIGMKCDNENMALWLLRAIVVENITVRREDEILYFPAGANFKLDKEIKNIVTVVAKTHHYWREHIQATVKDS
jgi:cation diffusion facilitator family transporter